MREARATLVILLLFGTLTGCGTITNINGSDVWLLGGPVGPPTPFGGVGIDSQMVYDGTGSCTLALFDLPFSAVGDIITLPLVMFVSARTMGSRRVDTIRGPSRRAGSNRRRCIINKPSPISDEWKP